MRTLLLAVVGVFGLTLSVDGAVLVNGDGGLEEVTSADEANRVLQDVVNPLPLPYGKEKGDVKIFRREQTSNAFTFPRFIPFMGRERRSIYVHVDGFLSIEAPNANLQRPSSTTFLPAIAAAYWANFDISETGDSSRVWARLRYSFNTVARTANALITASSEYTSKTPFATDMILIATYEKLPRASSASRALTNTFQISLATDLTDTFAIVSYESMKALDIGAFGGFFGGDGTSQVFLDNLVFSSDLDALVAGTNCDRPGTYVYNVTGTKPTKEFDGEDLFTNCPAERAALELFVDVDLGDIVAPASDNRFMKRASRFCRRIIRTIDTATKRLRGNDWTQTKGGLACPNIYKNTDRIKSLIENSCSPFETSTSFCPLDLDTLELMAETIEGVEFGCCADVKTDPSTYLYV